MLSFHATKPYHCAEGGALVYKDEILKSKFDCIKNNGIGDDSEVEMIGTNAKMNELQALMGVKVLDHFDWILRRRRDAQEVYRERLSNFYGVRLFPKLPESVEHNYSFMPLQIYSDEFGMSRDALLEALKQYNIFARKYFSPLIPDLECYGKVAIKDPLVNARGAADRILALPLYADLEKEDIHRICDIIDLLAREKRARRA
jgi:dTDP-4-amino-4,6-dideoxygalactose transaminase